MRRNPPAKWVLPQTINPAARKCFVISVPDDAQHIAAFRGAMLALASAYKWADDPSHAAKDVAAVWRAVIDGMEDCETLQTKLRADDICTLSWSYDDWATFDSFDPSACILANIDSVVPGMIAQAIRDAINDGTLQQPGGQPGPQPRPDVGDCATYHVLLNANERWKIPSTLSSGDTIQVINAHGGWTDGAFLWYCQDGKSYVLGTCGNNNPYQAGDPLQSGNHMQIIGGYNTAVPVYFDPLTSVFAIPSGVVDQEGWIQANDGQLYDNSGQVEFDLTVCTGAWCYNFDFTTGLHGFTLYNALMHQDATGLWSSWSSGTSQDGIYFTRPAQISGIITQIDITFDRPFTGNNPEVLLAYQSPNVNMMDILASRTVYTQTGLWTLTNKNLAGFVDPWSGGFQAMAAHVLSITLHGSGINPFGADNC